MTASELAAVKATEARRIKTIQKVYGSVVAVFGKTRGGGGSGVIYDPEGYALTNYHVVRSTGNEGLAGLADGKLYPYRLVGIDPGGDVAIIKLQQVKDSKTGNLKPFPYSALGDDETVRVGDFVMAMGNPFVLAEDFAPTVTLGVVSGVKRYQEGQGGTNMLEYGDCIQIDSSINPGNSGGPLFNMHGQVIGINGRGSFEERGRVNVGVGYAIGINQIKKFIPDMMATKVAMHATIKATFGTRANIVVCDQIDLDGVAYKAGLRLGDRLISFDGRPMRTANQFKNYLTTLPAHWPAELVWTRDGKEHRAWLRVAAAPYPKQPQRGRPQPKPKPGDEDKPADGKQVAPPKNQPGVIRDAKLNRASAEKVLREYRAFLGGEDALAKVKGFVEQTDVVTPDGEVVAKLHVLVTMDGRYVETVTPSDGPAQRNIFDGTTLVEVVDGKITKRVTGDEAIKSPGAGIVRLISNTLYGKEGWAWPKQLVLEGADKSLGMPAYRLRIEDEHGTAMRLWLSVDDPEAGPRPNGIGLVTRMLKIQSLSDGKSPAVAYLRFEQKGPLLDPVRKRIVIGDAEEPGVSFIDRKVEVLDEIPAGAFDLPS